MKLYQLRSRFMIVVLSVFVLASVVLPYPQNLVTVHGEGNEIPHLLITEIVAESTPVNGSDGYEFVEIYNPTNQIIHLKDYNLLYRYPENVDDKVWPLPENLIIEPGKPFVFWIGNPENLELTAADFNANYGSLLEEGVNLQKIEGESLNNDRMRTIVIATKSGHEIAAADFNDASNDAEANNGVFYQYPKDGTNKMVKLGPAAQPATPGSVGSNQVPPKLIPFEQDRTPKLENPTQKIQNHPENGVEFVVGSKNGKMIKNLVLYYKIDDDQNYTEVPFDYSEEDSLYHYRINDLARVLGSKQIQYYMAASNNEFSVTSETYQTEIRRDNQPFLNVTDQQMISGSQFIKGAARDLQPDEIQLSIDGVPVEGYPTIGDTAYFLFQGDAMDKGYNNSVTMGKEMLFLMNEAPSGLINVPLSKGLTAGANKVEIRSGDYHKTYYADDVPEGKLNTFIVKDFRLLLGDGTILRDSNYPNPSKEYRIGGTNPPLREFSFNIPQEKMDAIGYQWDTSQVTDGEHVIKVETKDGKSAESTITVDNHGPIIETNIEAGKQYKGDFTIQAQFTEKLSGIQNKTVLLDGEPIEVPYKTSSAKLTSGDHFLQIRTVDGAGNKSEQAISFTTVEETPVISEIQSPVDGTVVTNQNVGLNVKVSDPTNDEMDVTFYQGEQYQVTNREQVKVFVGETASAPAQKLVPEGERELTQEEYEKILNGDQDVFTSESNQFPYLRLEAAIDSHVDKRDKIQLHWEGKTLNGHRLTLMAWNHQKHAWTVIDDTMTQKGDLSTLTGDVPIQDYVLGDKVNFMIQDQDYVNVPSFKSFSLSKANDYTFAWITDTQYNVEASPHILKSQIDWIKDNIDDRDIKYVIHTGDIVNRTFEETQWKLADEYLRTFDLYNIPYGVLAGNHDMGQGYILNFDYSNFYKYFGQARFEGKSYYGGSYKNNRGHYDLISANGKDYIMVYMGWGDGDPNPNWLKEDIEWMNQVLAAYPNRTAILNFHKYLHSNGQLEPANGKQIFDEVVVPNKNVAMVLSGHYTGSGILTSAIDDNGDKIPDRNVYQILSDYQGAADGGSGYMKLLQFNPEGNKVNVQTYSPYLDDYDPNHVLPGKGEYTLDLDLTPTTKQVATDSINIRVYKNKKIGSVKHVKSGQNAEFQWKGLKGGQTYYWYAVAEDRYDGWVMTDLQSFTTASE
ncbi:metallophosphoesterase [Neobacillus dielmonensis]|uniref:metallophosphoesterase n=1 Tax=Neobacillus dielmonensis TaxID=1347369 RepID=UPI0006946557|nr:metallophosphoesterase [Neobacillus dielmonensis]